MKLRYGTLLIATAGVFGALTACSPAGGGGGGGGGLCTPLAASIDTPTSLPAGCYTSAGDVSVNAPLTLAPGVTITFAQDSVMDVNAGGSLDAVGSSATGGQIVFKGAQDVSGFWGGINVYSISAQNDLDYVEVRDAGSSTYGNGTAVWVASGIPFTMKHTTIDLSGTNGLSFDASASVSDIHLQANTYQNIDAYPVSASADAAGALDPASVYSSNGKSVVEVFGGDVVTAQTWHHLAVPYFLDNADVSVDAPLTVAPSTAIEFDQDISMDTGVGAGSSGSLTAVGDATHPITFEGAVNQSNEWGHLRFDSNSAANHLSYVTIRNAGSINMGETADIYVYNGGSLTMDNSLVDNSSSSGYVSGLCWDPGLTPDYATNVTFVATPPGGAGSITDCAP